MYLSEISQYEPLSPDKEVELAVLIAKGDKDAMKELVEANLRFVVSVAKKYQGNGLSLSDIINEGNLGLIKAAKRFDPSRGFKFISYAVWWIRQAILQALAEQGRLIRLPLNRVGTITKITKAAEKLEAEMGRPPKVEEISHQLDVKSEEVFNALQYSRRHSSLDAPFAEGEDSSLINVIEDEQEKDPDNKVMDTSMKEEIASALSTLTERERSVIEMYFGINRDRSFTLNEIGEQFSLTRERVRQIKEKAIRRLAHKTRSEPLEFILDSSLNPVFILFPIFPIILIMHIHTAVNAFQIRKSLMSKELDYRWLKYMPGWQEIPLNIQASRELYKNLFEAPVPFLVYCLFAYTVSHVTILNLSLAWLYVAFRVWHYFVRMSNPKISKRRVPFQYSLIVTFILWTELFIFLVK